MRLFIATEFSADITSYLSLLQKECKSLPATQTFTHSFHLTYQFLGERSDSEVAQLKANLSKLVFHKIVGTLDQLGLFPERSSDPKVLWIGLSPEDQIMNLQKEIAKITGHVDDHPFSPHLTLSRIKSSQPGFVKSVRKISIEKRPFTIESIKLVSSTLTPSGPIYQDILVVDAQALAR